MRRSFLIYWLLALALSASQIGGRGKVAFYQALSGGQPEALEQMLAALEAEKAAPLIDAYKGALTMKKAGFMKGAGAKVKTFKKGALLLEAEIKSDPANAELRFLRLTIQEHAPGILKYNQNLQEDRQAVISAYGKLGSELRQVIADYAKDSKVLKASDLK